MTINDSGLAAALKSRNRIAYFGLLTLTLLALPGLTIFFSRSVELEITPNDDSAEPIISIVEGFAPKLFGKFLVVSRSVTFKVNQKGFSEAVIEHQKSSGLSKLFISLEPLPGEINLKVDYEGEFIMRIPQADYFSSEINNEIDLPAGDLDLIIEGPMIETFRETLEIIGKETEQSFVFKPKIISSYLTFRVNPSSAEVLVNGSQRDGMRGTYNFNLEKGRYEILLKATGFLDHKESVVINDDENIDLGLIRLKPRPVSIFFESKPSSASVFLDDKFIGSTPLEVFVTPGTEREFKLRKSGYVPEVFKILPETNSGLRKEIIFEKEVLMVRVSAEPESKINLNGQQKGLTPMSLNVRKGDLLEVTAEGFEPVRETVTGMISDNHEYRFSLIPLGEVAYINAPEVYFSNQTEMVKIQGNLDEVDQIYEEGATPKAVDFYVSATEITNDAFNRYKAGNKKGLTPITKVSWLEAVKYCNWLSENENIERFYVFGDVSGVETVSFNSNSDGYRLLTKNEWIYLVSNGAKGKLASDLPWKGQLNDIPRGIGNIAGRELAKTSSRLLEPYVDSHPGLAPVKSFRPSVWGVYDLVGNAREWLHNTGGPNDSYFGRAYGTGHIVAGSSFESFEKRDLVIGNFRVRSTTSDDVGFRVARSIK